MGESIFSRHLSELEAKEIAERAAVEQTQWRREGTSIEPFARSLGRSDGSPITAEHQLANNPPPDTYETNYEYEIDQGEKE